MFHFASPADVQAAAAVINSAFASAGTTLTTGTKIEVGLAMLIGGLRELRPSSRGHVLRRVVGALLDAFSTRRGKHAAIPEAQLPSMFFAAGQDTQRATIH